MLAAAESPRHITLCGSESTDDVRETLSIYRDIGMGTYSTHLSKLYFMNQGISYNHIIGAIKICKLLTHITITLPYDKTHDIATEICTCIQDLPFITSVEFHGGKEILAMMHTLMMTKPTITAFSLCMYSGSIVARFPTGISYHDRIHKV